MEIIEQLPGDELVISQCDGFSCVINNDRYTQSILIYQKQIIPWKIDSITQLCFDNLEPIIKLNPDCVLFGTGPSFHFLSPKYLEPIITAQIGYECMSSLTACGSYQLLAGDGRDFLLALYLEQSEQ